MWALRVLNGSAAGQVFSLKPGVVRLGRAESCGIRLNSAGISKEHLEITVLNDSIKIVDLKSSNGTYVNGTRIQAGKIKLGDKILLSQVLMDVVLLNQQQPQLRALSAPGENQRLPANLNSANLPAAPGNQNFPSIPEAPSPQLMPADNLPPVQAQIKKINDYVERVAMPGVYKLPQVFEFRYVILGFVGLYIVLLTMLSILPLNQITSESISIESRRRALTVARALSELNQRALRSGDLTSFKTDLINQEEGIEDAYVVARDGKILAPAERIGLSPKEAGFIQKIKGSLREYTDEIGGGKVAASVPIVSFDPDLQQNVAKAFAVTVYNPGNLTFDDGRAFSLFVQVLTLAIVAGAILFFFMYKLIEYPFKLLFNELDVAMREGREQVQVNFIFPALQNLMTSINSLLSRVANGNGESRMATGKGSRDAEIFNLMVMIGFPSILIDRAETIIKVSPGFEAVTEIPAEKLLNNKVSDIPDPAMQQNMRHLMNQSTTQMGQINSDGLEIAQIPYTLNCLAMVTPSGDIEYFLITVTPPPAAEGAA